MAMNYEPSMPLPTVSWGDKWETTQFECAIATMPREIEFHSNDLEEYHQFLNCDKSGLQLAF